MLVTEFLIALGWTRCFHEEVSCIPGVVIEAQLCDKSSFIEAQFMSETLHLSHKGNWRFADGEFTFRALRDYHGLVPGCDKTVCISVGTRGVFSVYFLSSEIERSREYGATMFTDPERVHMFLAESEQVVQMVERVGTQLEQMCVSTATKTQLAEALRRCNEAFFRLYAYYQLSSRDFSETAWQSVRTWLDGRVFETRDVLNCLTAANTAGVKSFQEMENWLSILKTYYDSNQKITAVQNQISDHADQYGFLGVAAYRASGLNASDYLQKLLKTQPEEVEVLRLRVEERRKRASHLDRRASVCAQRLGLPESLLLTCRAIALLSVSRLKLREASLFLCRAGADMMRKIYDYVDNFLGQPVNETLKRQLTIEEIEEVLQTGSSPSVKRLQERYETSLTELREGHIHTAIGAAAEAQKSHLCFYQTEFHPDRVMKGTVVSGKDTVVGQALVLKAKDIKDIPTTDPRNYAGRIVIIPMMRPSIIPACADVAGLVVEEGGLTSHAAVVAREFGMFCVVGVAGATQVFKTGEWLKISASTESIQPIPPDRDKPLQISINVKPTCKTKEHKDFYSVASNLPVLTTPALVSLESPVASDKLLVGGKAANLHRIHTWTPKGFILTTSGIRRYMSSQHEHGHNSQFLEDPPDAFQREVESYLKPLGPGTVAVRSSHCNEDSAEKSYAGIFQSFINVDPHDFGMFWQAVSNVADSARNESVSQYQGIHWSSSRDGSMAVLVQRMVHPVVSGVAFTSIRRSERNWLLLEYRYGGLAPLVSGLVSPQRSAIPRDIFLRTCRTPEFAYTHIPPGIEDAVSIDVVNQLGHRIADVEASFGTPLEIEWAIDDNDSVWILQARPITFND